MGLLYLIRHPLTLPDPARPASTWGLAPEGEAQIASLRKAAFWRHVSAVYTSTHAKTRIVGTMAREAYGLPVNALPGLDEARRDVWVDPESFLDVQARFLAEPNRAPVPRWESAQAAFARFSQAMNMLLAQHDSGESLAVVSHGTVLTLYQAALYGEKPTLEAWRAIGFAAVCAVDRVTMQPVTAFLLAPYDGLPHP